MIKEINSIISKGPREKGTVLVIAFIIMGVLVVLGTYFISFTLTELRISKSQTVGTQAYYLAEAGINQAIWKLKHEWKNDFETNLGWSASFTTSTDGLVPNSSIAVTVQNSTSTCASGEITATSTIALGGGKTAQRVVKIGVFKAIGGPTVGIAVFSEGKEGLKIRDSKVNIYNGDIFSNKKITIEWESEVTVWEDNIFSNDKVEVKNKSKVTVGGKILAFKKFDEREHTITIASAICAENVCDTTSTCECEGNSKFQECEATPGKGKCPPEKIDKDLPMVNFHEGSESYKAKAKAAQAADECNVFWKKEGDTATTTDEVFGNKCFFDRGEFAILLWFKVGQGGTLTLDNDITYVNSPLIWLKSRTLIVNGVLAAGRDIKIGEDSQLLIKNDDVEYKASGLLSDREIKFGEYASSTITGLLYASKKIEFKNISKPITVTGGIISKEVKCENFKDQGELNVYLKDSIVNNVLKNQEFSSVINIEHWEETY